MLITSLVNLKSFSTSLARIAWGIMSGFNMLSHVGIRSLSNSASFANVQSFSGFSKKIPHFLICIIHSWPRSPGEWMDNSCKNENGTQFLNIYEWKSIIYHKGIFDLLWRSSKKFLKLKFFFSWPNWTVLLTEKLVLVAQTFFVRLLDFSRQHVF